MDWGAYCGNIGLPGTKVDMKALLKDDLAAQNSRTGFGLPAQRGALNNAINVVQCFPIGKADTTKEMSFMLREIGELSTPGISKLRDGDIIKYKVGKLKRDCYEQRIFVDQDASITTRQTPILIHQSLAPCPACKAGYTKLAFARQSIIIMSIDVGHDGAEDNSIFFFIPLAPNGICIYGKN